MKKTYKFIIFITFFTFCNQSVDEALIKELNPIDKKDSLMLYYEIDFQPFRYLGDKAFPLTTNQFEIFVRSFDSKNNSSVIFHIKDSIKIYYVFFKIGDTLNNNKFFIKSYKLKSYDSLSLKYFVKTKIDNFDNYYYNLKGTLSSAENEFTFGFKYENKEKLVETYRLYQEDLGYLVKIINKYIEKDESFRTFEWCENIKGKDIIIPYYKERFDSIVGPAPICKTPNLLKPRRFVEIINN